MRPVLLLVPFALALLDAGCAMRDARRADTGTTTVVLLTDDDGTTGAARVSNAQGAIDLTRARETTDVGTGRAPSATRIMDDGEVQQVFGAALAALPLPPVRIVLRFQFDSDDLTEESRAVLPALVRQVRERPSPEVVVIGHTDTIGASDLNQQLGQRRADTVRRVLVDAGVSPDVIESRSHGEADPIVRTGDETSQPANRRVEITLR
jgi:outer membrane protein OmpA-like peptidoglycan-associated protein